MKVAVIGAGLAGCEAAHLLSKNGISVDLYEMKPYQYSEAHSNAAFAELVCSNSLKSIDPLRPSAMLKKELLEMNSVVISAAYQTRVPAGESLAVDRNMFSARITESIIHSKNITVINQVVEHLPEGYDHYIIATGPLTHPVFAEYIASLVGQPFLYFYDAIAPILDAESIDMSKALLGSRHDPTNSDFINILLSADQYHSFVKELVNGQKVPLRAFEKEIYYERCLPVEVLASRGVESLAYGPMKPTGFVSGSGERPYAVVQLRKEDVSGSSYNMVGFQTKLTYSEQDRIFRSLPGLERAFFLRYGSIHRNTFIDSPKVLLPTMNLKALPSVFFGGQITGVEGYVESAAAGFLCAFFLLFAMSKIDPLIPNRRTAFGALLSHLQNNSVVFQPSGIHAGLFEPVEVKKKKDKKPFIAEREQKEFAVWKKAVSELILF